MFLPSVLNTERAYAHVWTDGLEIHMHGATRQKELRRGVVLAWERSGEWKILEALFGTPRAPVHSLKTRGTSICMY